MTKLENLWDDYPVDPPPTSDILRAGRLASGVRRRRLLTRPLAVTAGLAALAVAFTAGTLIHSGADSGGTGVTAQGPLGSDASPVAFQAGLTGAKDCNDLLHSYVDRGLALVRPWGWNDNVAYPTDGRLSYAQGSEDLMKAPGPVFLTSQTPAAALPNLSGVTASDTGTNVQEVGVDEPDTVKTDGHELVRIDGTALVVSDVSGPAVVQQARLTLPRITDPQLLLAGDTVIAIGTDAIAPDLGDGRGPQGSRVLSISLQDPAHPAITDDVAYSAPILGARQHGDVVRLVLASGLPDLNFVTPGTGRTNSEALKANRALISDSTIKDWLPTYDDGHGPQQLLDCTSVAVPDDDLGLDTVSVVGFKAGAPATFDAIGLVAASTISYESADELILAASPATFGCWECLGPAKFNGGPRSAPTQDGKSSLFEFTLDGMKATHVASGQVAGSIADRWSIDEAGGVLRVALGPSDGTAPSNSVVTLRRSGDRLAVVGRLGGLGRGEQIKAVRWFDDLALVVTYRETDPLYAIDLSDPRHPRKLSAMQGLGYSTYLHPLSPSRILGVGVTGVLHRAKAMLFDVSDLAKVHQVSVVRFARDTYAAVNDEPKAFTWLPSRHLALTVIQRNNVNYIGVIDIGDTSLRAHTVKVSEGSDATGIRTIGLPDGRVLLVTGGGVRFLPL